MFLTALKTAGALILMKWGSTGVRTFRPIIKDLQNEQLSEITGVAIEQKLVAVTGSKCCSKEPVPIK